MNWLKRSVLALLLVLVAAPFRADDPSVCPPPPTTLSLQAGPLELVRSFVRQDCTAATWVLSQPLGGKAPYKYHWFVDEAEAATTDDSDIVLEFNTRGIYFISVIVEDAEGAISQSDTAAFIFLSCPAQKDKSKLPLQAKLN